MTPEDEQSIERYILDASSLSADERAAVEALLASDPAAAAWAQTLRAVYEEARNAPPSEAAAAFVDDLFPRAPVLHLHPVQRDHPLVSTVASADGHRRPPAEADASSLRAVQMAANESEEVLVRLFGPTASTPGRLYVLADQRALWEHVVVTFPDLNLDVPTDDRGAGTIPPCPDWTSDLSPLSLRRVLALARLPAPPPDDATLTFDSGHTFRLKRNEDHLRVRLTTKPADAPAVRRIRVDSSSDKEAPPSLGVVTRGEGTVSLPDSEGALVVRLYG